MKTAKIVKVPKKYMVIVDGQIVDFAHSAYQSTEIARHYEAEQLEMIEWKRGTSFSSLTSALRSGLSTRSSKQPKVRESN